MSTPTRLLRFHEVDLAPPTADPCAVAVVQTETTAPDGISDVQLEETLIRVYGEMEEFSAPQARAVGLALVTAAELLDRIMAAASAGQQR